MESYKRETFESKYRQLYLLGEGAFGKVYAIEDKQTNKLYAVKIVEKCIKDLKSFEKLNMEKRLCERMATGLSHPNLVKIHQVMSESLNMYIIMDYIDEGDLYDAIDSITGVAEPTARRWFKQLMEAVLFMHTNGIVHRDLKPENILVDNRQRLKICDFGLATEIKCPNEKLTKLCGTTTYASPEITSGKSYCGPPADVWSCGVILYKLLTGRLPFRREKTSDLQRDIVRAKYTIPPSISVEASDLIRNMLHKNPKKRLTVQQCLLHPWFDSPPPYTFDKPSPIANCAFSSIYNKVVSRVNA